ncbi:hypothetical protein [uncultured Ruegeria sp.]|uniref:hypothetical protein n=1 Tax=uncultured Ruegeria sp. TaxID=259304 RepID=UPI00260FC833|nr:hypothetical protein [uncultured Ruegeria sp.]
MFNKYIVFRLLVVATVTTGCSDSLQQPKPAKINDQDYLFATDVAFAAKCEFDNALKFIRTDKRYQAIAKRFSFPQAAADLTLKVVAEDGATASPNISIPINSVVVTLGGNLKQTRKTTKTLSLKMHFAENDEPDCEDAYEKSESKQGSPKPIEGGLGLDEWIIQLVDVSFNLDEAPTFASYNIDFEIDGSADLDSKVFKQSQPKTRFRSFSFSPSRSKNIKHTFAITATICDEHNRSVNAEVCKSTEGAAKQAQLELNNFLIRMSDD